MTKYLEAKQALVDGLGADVAWTIAQQDEGLLPHVTKELWVRETERMIEQEAQTKAAYANLWDAY